MSEQEAGIAVASTSATAVMEPVTMRVSHNALKPSVVSYAGCLVYKDEIEQPEGKSPIRTCFRCDPGTSVIKCRLEHQHVGRNHDADVGTRGFDRQTGLLKRIAISLDVDIDISEKAPAVEAVRESEAVSSTSTRSKRGASAGDDSTRPAGGGSRRVRQKGGSEYLDDDDRSQSLGQDRAGGEDSHDAMQQMNAMFEHYPELDPLPDEDEPQQGSEEAATAADDAIPGSKAPKVQSKFALEQRAALDKRIKRWLNVMDSDAAQLDAQGDASVVNQEKAVLVATIRSKYKAGGVAALRLEDLEILKSRGLHMAHADYLAVCDAFPSASEEVLPVVRSVLSAVDVRVQATTQVRRAHDFMAIKKATEDNRHEHYAAAREVIQRRADKLSSEYQQSYSNHALERWQAERTMEYRFLRSEEAALVERLRVVRAEMVSFNAQYEADRQDKATLRSIHRARVLQNEDDRRACDALVASTARTRVLLETFRDYVHAFHGPNDGDGNKFIDHPADYLAGPLEWAETYMREEQQHDVHFWRILHEGLRVACTLVHLHTGYNPLADPCAPPEPAPELPVEGDAAPAAPAAAACDTGAEVQVKMETDLVVDEAATAPTEAVPVAPTVYVSAAPAVDMSVSTAATTAIIEPQGGRVHVYQELRALLNRCESHYAPTGAVRSQPSASISASSGSTSSGSTSTSSSSLLQQQSFKATVVLSDPRTLYHQVPNDLPERAMRVMRIMHTLTKLQEDLTISYDGNPKEGVLPYDQAPVVCLAGGEPNVGRQGVPKLPFFMECVSLVHSDRYRTYLEKRVAETHRAPHKLVALKDEAGVLDSESEHDFDLDEEAELDVSENDVIEAAQQLGETLSANSLAKWLRGKGGGGVAEEVVEEGSGEGAQAPTVPSTPPPPSSSQRKRGGEDGTAFARQRCELQFDQKHSLKHLDHVLVLPPQEPDNGDNRRHSRKYSVKVNRLGLPNESAIAVLSAAGLEGLDVDGPPQPTDRISLWEPALNRLSNSGPHFRNLKEHLNRSPNLIIWVGQGKRNETTLGHLRSLVWLRRALLDFDATEPLPHDFYTKPGDMVGSESPEVEAGAGASASVSTGSDDDDADDDENDQLDEKANMASKRDKAFEAASKKRKHERQRKLKLQDRRRGLTKRDFLMRTWVPDERVTMWHTTKRYKVAGRNSPLFRDLADFMLKKPEFVVYRGQDLKDEPKVGGEGVENESHAGYGDGSGDVTMGSVADGSAQLLDGSVGMDLEENEHTSEGVVGVAVKDEVVVRELQSGEVVVMPSKAAVRREEEAHKRTHEGETFVDAFMQQQSSYFPFKNTTVINGRVAVGNAFIVHDDTEELVCPAGWWEDLESPSSDTYLSPRSVEAALAAAEIVCKAVDLIFTGAADGYAIPSVPNVQNVFCCVRPPGHHSGRYGNTAGCGQNGFCLLNNVAIGATYGRVKHGLRRVAVIDIDAHFGNGTAEILSNDPHAFYASVHLQYETPGRFFPSSACCTIGKDITSPNLVLVNVYPPNSKTSQNMFSKSKVPRGRGGFRRALSETVYPAVRAFEPDIIFVSAGFDGSHTDPIGGHLGLRPEDFHHISREIRELADEVCGGRIVSVLEGGYDLDAKTDGLATCVEAHVLALAGLHRN